MMLPYKNSNFCQIQSYLIPEHVRNYFRNVYFTLIESCNFAKSIFSLMNKYGDNFPNNIYLRSISTILSYLIGIMIYFYHVID